MNDHPQDQWVMAVCLRFNMLGLVVLSQHEIVEVRRRCLYHTSSKETPKDFASRAITEMASDYGLSVVVVEPDSQTQVWLKNSTVSSQTRSLDNAKELILPEGQPHTHPFLCRHLVNEFPKLRNIATVLPATGNVAMTQRWQVVPLLAVALGIAAQKSRVLTIPSTHQ